MSWKERPAGVNPAGRCFFRSPRWIRWRRWTLGLLVVLGLLGALGLWGLRGLGHWLVTADPLEPARAVVVLGGHIPFRAMEAAAIYREGWAGQVWLTRGTIQPEEVALMKLGIPFDTQEFYNREVLQRLGVPPEAIRVLDERVETTAEEVQLVARELRRVGGDRVILVTSKVHSRRVHATWRALIGDAPRPIVRYAREDPYEPEGWWRRSRDALVVSREVFGLLNMRAGFPVRPDRR